jgi:ribosomal protein S18 acetylase RimI-like enzyme
MIRAATLADAPAVAQVHVASWRAGYRGLVPDAYLAELSVEERTAMWEMILSDSETTVLVATHEERIDGFVAFHAQRAEVRALYVDPPRFRTGVGTALLEAAHERLSHKPEIVLWVLQGNDVARAFYEGHGYAVDNATAIHEATGAVQVRMARRRAE